MALERKTSELNKTNVKLEEMLALNEHVAKMSRHDLKSPLGTIISLPEFLIETRGNELDQEVQECLEMIKRSGLKMLEMINRSLDLSRLEMGAYVLDPQPVDLIPILHRIKSDLRSQLGNPGRLRIELDGLLVKEVSVVNVWGEEHLIYPLLANLVLNAVEASTVAQEVKVSVENQQQGPVRLIIENEGDLPQGLRERFFDKYVTLGKKRGTGLGTYSSLLMAKAMGGGIELNTSTPHQIRLEVTLPRVPHEFYLSRP